MSTALKCTLSMARRNLMEKGGNLARHRKDQVLPSTDVLYDSHNPLEKLNPRKYYYLDSFVMGIVTL